MYAEDFYAGGDLPANMDLSNVHPFELEEVAAHVRDHERGGSDDEIFMSEPTPHSLPTPANLSASQLVQEDMEAAMDMIYEDEATHGDSHEANGM